MPIKLSKETREDLVGSLQKYFRDELDQEISEFRARMLLDYILIEIGPSVYNRAIRDAQRFFQEKTIDLEGSCYEEELTYWTQKKNLKPKR